MTQKSSLRITDVYSQRKSLKQKDVPGVLSELQEAVQHILVALLPIRPLEAWEEMKLTFIKVSSILPI